jgi:hypothetical protein
MVAHGCDVAARRRDPRIRPAQRADWREREASVDDDTGWNDVLTGVWSPRVRDAVVARIEAATVGARCLLVCTLRDEDTPREGWVEQLHQLVVEAIRAETGADLDELGSQAAWASYEEVWDALAARWRSGGELATVPLRREVAAVACLQQLHGMAAQAAGMDVGVDPPEPLWLAGRLRVDADGLLAVVADGRLDGAELLAAQRLLSLLQR